MKCEDFSFHHHEVDAMEVKYCQSDRPFKNMKDARSCFRPNNNHDFKAKTFMLTKCTFIGSLKIPPCRKADGTIFLQRLAKYKKVTQKYEGNEKIFECWKKPFTLSSPG